MAKVNFKRCQTISDLSNIDIVDGNFIVTGDGKTYVDYGNERKGIGGTPDLEMSDTSTNSVQNNVIKQYVDNNIDDIDEKKQNIPDILYSDSVGTSGNITLLHSRDDYNDVEIFFTKDGYENSVKISGNKASLIAHYTNTGNNTTYIDFKNITILGNSLTVDSFQEWYNNWGSDGITAGNTNGILITKVLGYK